MQTAHHWANQNAPPTVCLCGYSHWMHCARQWGETPSPPPGCDAATGAAPHESPPRSRIPTPRRVAPSCRPPWLPPPSPPTCTSRSYVTRSHPLWMAVHQGTCWVWWGNLTSVPCSLHRVGIRWPSSPQTPQQSAVAPYFQPQTAATSVGGQPSQSLQILLRPTVVVRQKPPSCWWCTLARRTVECLRRSQIFLPPEGVRQGYFSGGLPRQACLTWGRCPPSERPRPSPCQLSTGRMIGASPGTPGCGRSSLGARGCPSPFWWRDTAHKCAPYPPSESQIILLSRHPDVGWFSAKSCRSWSRVRRTGVSSSGRWWTSLRSSGAAGLLWVPQPERAQSAAWLSCLARLTPHRHDRQGSTLCLPICVISYPSHWGVLHRWRSPILCMTPGSAGSLLWVRNRSDLLRPPRRPPLLPPSLLALLLLLLPAIYFSDPPPVMVARPSVPHRLQDPLPPPPPSVVLSFTSKRGDRTLVHPQHWHSLQWRPAFQQAHIWVL